jgi:RNA polymerase sigma-70 factor (sigma-E family)
LDRHEGFREFVHARGAALGRSAFLLTGDRDTAADLLQTALMKTAERWRQVVDGGNPEAYVRKVMINQRTSWWRRDRSAKVVALLERPVGDGTERTDDRLLLAPALAALPVRQRAIVVLRFYEDYSVSATAEALGCSEGTVKSQTHDALRRLRRLLPDLDRLDQEASA